MIVPCPRCGHDLKIPAPIVEMLAEAVFWSAGVRSPNSKFYNEPQDVNRVMSDLSQAAYAFEVEFDFGTAELALNVGKRLLREYIEWRKLGDVDHLSVFPARMITGQGIGYKYFDFLKSISHDVTKVKGVGWEAPARIFKKWEKNKGVVTGDGLIAHVFDPIWSKISVFKLPFPPFFREVKSDYCVENVDANEAEASGIHVDDFNPFTIDEGNIFVRLSTVIFDLIKKTDSQKGIK